jgi:hypothetical protein
LQNYCLAAQLAAAQKMFLRGRQPHPAASLVRCGYVVNAQRYRSLLQTVCQQQGVSFVAVDSLSPQIELGQLVALHSPQGLYTADKYFDCTTTGLLANALGLTESPVLECPPVTVTRLPPSGPKNSSSGRLRWQKQCLDVEPLLGEGGWRYEWAPPSNRIQVQPFKNSVRSHAWVGNCVLLGEAYAQLPSFLVDPLHRLRSGILRFINCWSPNAQATAPARVFNRRSQEELSGLAMVDNYLLHCALGSAVPLLPDVAHKRALFQAQGRMPLNEAESLSGENWQMLFYACGERLQGQELLMQTINPEAWQEKLSSMRRFFAQVVTHATPVAGG